MNSFVPSLSRVCVAKIVKEIKLFCRGVDFENLGNYSLIVGPLDCLPSTCIETIFDYVISTRQLSREWLSVLIVTHLKAIDFTLLPSYVNSALLKTLIYRCQCLEKLVIPNCKKISNKSLCELISKNPSLLELDLLNKLSPTIDQSVLNVFVKTCRFLTVLKLSDYRQDDSKTLLVICGRREKVSSKSKEIQDSSSCTADVDADAELKNEEDEMVERVNNLFLLPNPSSVAECIGGGGGGGRTMRPTESDEVENLEDRVCDSDGNAAAHSVKNINSLTLQHGENDLARCFDSTNENSGEKSEENNLTQEEEENQKGRDSSDDHAKNISKSEPGSDDEEEDLYENDTTVEPLEVEDHSSEFGCLELQTLWLDNVNLTDQVAAVLLQSLTRLRDINLSDTDICNPWRLLDHSQSTHLKHLEDLDVKSTALSRTALQLIPKFHPYLHKLSISSTTLPPPIYANIAQLTGLAELELIGGQFYPCEPGEIFIKGILPAVSGVGQHLHSLNLTYFAHVIFNEIVLSCPRIRYLDLSHTNIFISYPCPPIGKHCPNLTTLNLGFASIEAKDASLQLVSEDKVTQQMIGEPPVLEELQLCGLVISDEGMESMYQGAEYPLQVLNVSRCKMLTIAGVQHVWKKCPFLTKINITHCRMITLAAYKEFEKNCIEARPIFGVEGCIEWK